jgi:hypothetical protein
MEERHVCCSQDAVDEYFNTLEQFISGIPCNIIYIVDEVGLNEQVDATKWDVVAPIDYDGSTVPVPKNWSDSRASMIACVSAAGRARKPIVAILRKTTEIEFYECGFTSDVVSLA